MQSEISLRFFTDIYISKIDDPKAPFSIAITLRCRGWRYTCPLISQLYPLYVP